MSDGHDIEHLRSQLADYERKSRKTKWLLGQLSKKVANFPQDIPKKFKHALNKYRSKKGIVKTLARQPQIANLGPEKDKVFFVMNGDRHSELLKVVERDPPSIKALNNMTAFNRSDTMRELVRRAAAISPDVGSLHDIDLNYLSPWHDGDYLIYRKALEQVPEGPWDYIVLVPFGKLGGADFVAGVLADALSSRGRTLILRTDLPDWERPDWYPQDVPSVDISQALSALPNPVRALYFMLRNLGARHVINVNSRLAFDMFVEYGERLALTSNVHAYYFCADRDAQGNETGYPVWYFAPILPFLSTAICDSADLAGALARRYALPPRLQAKLKTIYTPARSDAPDRGLVEAQIYSQSTRQTPRILWAGRLDRQKRFDIIVALAKVMPDIQFECWGKAVLDAPPNLSDLPSNLNMHGAFKDFSDLPLTDCDGWLYTSEWDGLPTTLIELGAMGMPIVASAVGGVPELIDETTGWPVAQSNGVAGYESALREMLNDSNERRKRALTLKERVVGRHGFDAFCAEFMEIV